MSRLAALLAAVLSSTALAQEVGPALEYTWSGGVGVRVAALGSPIGSSIGLVPGGLGGLAAIGVPVVLTEAGVERRVSETTSLLLGLNGSYTTSASEPVPPVQMPLEPGLPMRNESTTGWVAGAVGVRRWLTDSSSPVLLSVAATASLGYARSWAHWLTTVNGTPAITSGDAWSTSVSVGGSVSGERFLTDALSLRLSLDVFRAGYSFGKARQPFGVGAGRSSGFSAGLSLSPALELRLYL